MYNVELSAHLYNSNTISPNKEYNNNRQFTNDTEITLQGQFIYNAINFRLTVWANFCENYEFASYSLREYK